IARTLQSPVPGADIHPDCVAAYEEASSLLASLGHEVEDIALPLGPDVVPYFETLWYGYATLAPIDPSQEGMLRPLTRYLREKGNATGAAELIFAQAYLQAVTRVAVTVLGAYDAVLTPTLARPPVPVGYFDEVEPAENFERQKLFTPFTAIYNMAGLPAVNVPLHWNAEGLPIGIMLAGRMGDEGTLISLSAQLEKARPWKDRHPPIW
ncbi:MAG: amidase family protein, partial [Streptosporangiaceae bacterium]